MSSPGSKSFREGESIIRGKLDLYMCSIFEYNGHDEELTTPVRASGDAPGRQLNFSLFITASNATNNKGMVFVAAVITRGTWSSEISLVGHENTVEVAVSCSLSIYTVLVFNQL